MNGEESGGGFVDFVVAVFVSGDDLSRGGGGGGAPHSAPHHSQKGNHLLCGESRRAHPHLFGTSNKTRQDGRDYTQPD